MGCINELRNMDVVVSDMDGRWIIWMRMGEIGAGE